MKRLVWMAALALAACGGSAEPNLYSTDPYERYLGTQGLGESPDGETLRRLGELLKDPNALPRLGALIAFEHVGRPEFYRSIQESKLFLDPDRRVREQVCRTAGALGDPAAIPDLAKVARERDEDPFVRQSAVKALAGFGSRRDVLEALVDVLNQGGGAAPRPASELVGERTVVASAHEALKTLTGQQFSDDQTVWKEWLTQRRGS